MLNFLVETKNEYTTHLINILTPLVFGGVMSVYNDSFKTSNGDDILKVFQTYLKQIPKWNQSIIERETDRIVNSSQSYGWINDLIKATLKSNLMILMYNPTCKKQNKVDPLYYQHIKTTDFIHKVYIECAREFYNNPYLFIHTYPPLEIKRNQRDCLLIIKDCIREAVRKLLPVKHILQMYLGEEVDLNCANQNFDKVMSEGEEKNLEKMIQKDLNNIPSFEMQSNMPMQLNEVKEVLQKEVLQKEVGYNSPTMKPIELIGGKELSNTEDKTIGSKILGIIHSPKNIASETSSLSAGGAVLHSDFKSDSMIQNFESAMKPNKNFDDRLKNILKKDLATDSDMETSLNYDKEDDNAKYQEIFSNSNQQTKDNKDNKKEKNKYFSNYLNL